MTAKRKTPTKAELLQLQKLYKTDEKIGERLGGVPAYLVAYWRRKKNVPKYSLPKFSENDIRTLWERFGDDDKCGLELGISKAAFYNWRRRYEIREKPAFLKLEQLELNFPGARISPHSNGLWGENTLAQKALMRAAKANKAEFGQEIKVEPDVVLVDENAAEIVAKFKEMGPQFVWNAGKIVITGIGNETGSEKGAEALEFAKRQRIRSVYDIREGSGSQVAMEKGHILSGHLALGAGGQIVAGGSVSSLSLSIDADSMAQLWAEGSILVRAPESVRIDLNGRRARGVYARDIALWAQRQLANESLVGKAMEFHGTAVSIMTVSERFTLSGLAPAFGAVAAVGPYDSSVRRYLMARASSVFTPVIADKNAIYAQVYQISIDQLKPMFAGTGENTGIQPVAEREGLEIPQIVLGGEANGRFDDLRIASDILKGKKVHPDCRLFIVPPSRTVYLDALKKGLIRIFVEAGAIVMHPGGERTLASSNTLLSTQQRTLTTTGEPLPGSEVYFCSPATAAASALHAALTDPTRFVK